MRIEERQLFNVLLADNGKVLINKQEFEEYEKAEEEFKGELNKTSIAYIPKTMTIEQAHELYFEQEA